MQSYWRFKMDCRSEFKARKVLNRVATQLGRTLSDVIFKAEETGFAVSCTVELQSTTWNDMVVEMIELGQRLAMVWRIISGPDTVREQLEGDTKAANLFTIPGLQEVYWLIESPSRR